MFHKPLTAALVSAALIAAPASRVSADAGDFVAGAIIGGIIGHAASQNKKKTVRKSGYSATRAANRDMQTHLNYFGFNAGAPDGVVGSRTRSAVSTYQAFLGYPATGNITQFERDILAQAYARAVAGGYDTQQLIARDPNGVKGVLVAQRNLMTGAGGTTTTGYAGLPIEVSRAVDEIASSSDPTAEQLLSRAGFIQIADMNSDGTNDYIIDTRISGSDFWCNQVQCKALVFASTANGYQRNNLLAFNPTPASFRCYGATCEVVDAGSSSVPVTANMTAPIPAAPVPAPQPALPGTQLAAAGTVAPAPVNIQPVPQPAPTPAPQPVTAPQPAPAPSTAAIPSFQLAQPSAPARSLSSYCSKVSLLTGGNGGVTEVSAEANPEVVLAEQFCLARAYTIDAAEAMVSKVVGADPAQIEAQCGQFGELMRPYITSLNEKPHTAVLGDLGGFVLNSGMAPSQLQTTGDICLGTGYRTDNLEVALGSAMLLVALGRRPYAELVGHHLSQGFGVAEADSRAPDWYEVALGSLEQGTEGVFAPAMANRVELLRWAYQASTAGVDAADSQTVSEPAPSVPTFSFSSD